MKFLKVLFYIFVFALLLIFIPPLFMSSELNVTVTEEMKADIPSLYNNVNDLKQWENWMAWIVLDTTMKLDYSDITVGKGASYKWTSEMYDGKLEILDSKKNEFVKTLMTMEGAKGAESNILFEEKDGKTFVSWTFHQTDVEYLGRWAVLFLKPNLVESYKFGLNRLDSISLLKPKYENIEITIKEMSSMPAYAIRDTVEMGKDDIQAAFQSAFMELNNFILANKIENMAPPFAITLSLEGNKWIFDAAFPVDKNTHKATGRIIPIEVQGGKSIEAVHKGPYSDLGKAYEMLEQYVKDNNYEINGFKREQYISDPNNVKPEDLITVIYYPIK